MQHEFTAKIAASPKWSELSINGNPLPYMRGFNICSHLDKGISTVTAYMLAIKPFEINGEGEIVIETIVVNEDIARQVYESLKKIFEDES
jgi:hypothetical protein